MILLATEVIRSASNVHNVKMHIQVWVRVNVGGWVGGRMGVRGGSLGPSRGHTRRRWSYQKSGWLRDLHACKLRAVCLPGNPQQAA